MAKILVADDDTAILEAIKLILESEGYDVCVTADGSTIYQMEKEKEYPDLLVLDIWMSGVNGTDICKYLKNNNRTKNIPVVMISANRDALEMAKKAGADDFVAKPFDVDDLLEHVEKNLPKQSN